MVHLNIGVFYFNGKEYCKGLKESTTILQKLYLVTKMAKFCSCPLPLCREIILSLVLEMLLFLYECVNFIGEGAVDPYEEGDMV